MADSIAYDLTGRVMGYLGQLAIDKVAPYFGGNKDRVNELAGTMRLIRARLGDAERRREGEDGEALKEWLRRLKNVLYRLEDLFEELSMADQEKQEAATQEGMLAKLVSLSILESRRLKMTKRLCQNVEDIMKEVNRIKSDMDLLNLREYHKIEHQGAVNMRAIENYCFLLEEEVIGRDEDKQKIIEMLLDSHQRVSVIPIVGFGGLGKTTLARLCYDDKNVQNHFEFKGWVCLSEFSSIDDLLKKILKSITSIRDVDKLEMQELQSHLHEAVKGKKYLLVLDDIWDENRERWLHLRRLLSSGIQGSKIIVTSRSKVVADNMGTVEPFEVEGLSEENSWALFRSLAFKEGQEERNPNLINIGREIVRMCGNVPLAIRSIASLLYSRDTEEEWLSLKDSKLRRMDPNDNKIMSTLKLSYDHLPSPLKQCFTYCSLFPKGYVYNTEQLIWLWMAQGFIRPSDSNERPEDIGHAYFMELWRRCFFQEVRRDHFGRIKDCKIHDLLYDLASKVGQECLLVIGSMEQDIDDGISHVSLIVDEYSSTFKGPSWFLRAKQMRSYLLYLHSLWDTQLNFKISPGLKSVRALILAGAYVQCLPNSIGELKHLRYLKVVVNSKYLPNGLTRLQNLQTLDLRRSRWLRELPSGFSKLINLRHLLMSSTYRLIDMSPRFGELTSLQTLDKFVVRKHAGLDALGGMNLAGSLKICFGECRVDAISEAMTANLNCKKLTDLELNWPVILGSEISFGSAKLLEYLEPPPTLQCLSIRGWEGEKGPSWGMNKFPCLLPNLVSVEIIQCRNCHDLMRFSQLPHLKLLVLDSLDALVCVEDDGDTSNSSVTYFQSLKQLKLRHLPQLKGWFSRMEVDIIGKQSHGQNHPQSLQFSQPCRIFPLLSVLEIDGCPKLTSIALAPRLRHLKAEHTHEKVINQLLMNGYQEATGTHAASSSLPLHPLSKFKTLYLSSIEGLRSVTVNFSPVESLVISSCEELKSVTAESPVSLRSIDISECSRIEDLSGVLRQSFSVLEDLHIRDGKHLDVKGLCRFTKLQKLCMHGIPNLSCQELMRAASQSLRELSIESCSGVEDISCALQHLSMLEELHIHCCKELDIKGLDRLPMLRSLHIQWLPNLKSLPEWIGHLTQLRKLCIADCPQLSSYVESFADLPCLTMLETLAIGEFPNLTGLPESIGHLPKLLRLDIWFCLKLKSLPDSFCNLTTLETLWISQCPRLIKRCKQPRGKYWPLVQHIPHLTLLQI